MGFEGGQRRLTFEIVSFEGAPRWWHGPLMVLVVLLLGLSTSLIAGRPVAWALRLLRVPHARRWAVPLSAGLALGLFSLFVPWELRGFEVAWLLLLTAVFFAVETLALEGMAPPSPPHGTTVGSAGSGAHR